MVKFSILCPTFNHEKYIGFFIESALQQDFTDYEIIIVDDCSSDNNIEEINKYKDSKITLIKHEYNQGVNAALNTAFANSNGEYLIFCAGDDMLESNILSRINNIVDENKNIVAIESPLNVIDENNNITSEINFKCENKIDALHKIFLKHACLTSPGLVVKREAFAKMYPLPLAMCNHQDTYMHVKLLLEGEIAFVNEKFVKYRQTINHKSLSNPHSITKSVRENFEMYFVLDLYIEYFAESKDLDLLEKVFANEISNLNIKPYDDTIEFFLGRMALESGDYCRQFWGYHAIMRAYNDSTKRKALKNRYNFVFKDLLHLSNLYNDRELKRLRRKYYQYRKRFNVMIGVCACIVVLFCIYVVLIGG